MSETQTLAESVSPTAPPGESCERIEDIYRKYRVMLRWIACDRFRIPREDADNLIQEIFLSLLANVDSVRNIRGWLVGAICNACRYYLRVHGRTEGLPVDVDEHSDPRASSAEVMALQMTIRQTLAILPPKFRETLHLHYYEGCSAAEIAERLETTPRYAEKLIHNSLREAQAIYTGLMTPK